MMSSVSNTVSHGLAGIMVALALTACGDSGGDDTESNDVAGGPGIGSSLTAMSAPATDPGGGTEVTGATDGPATDGPATSSQLDDTGNGEGSGPKFDLGETPMTTGASMESGDIDCKADPMNPFDTGMKDK